MLALIISVVLAMAVSAFCSFMEAALYSVPWSHIEQMRKSGSKAGELLFSLRSRVEQPITAVLTLNTIANTAGATIAGSFAAAALGETHTVIFAVVFTLLILVGSEIIPKTLGVLYCRAAAGFLAYSVSFLVLALKPLILVLGLFTRLFGSKNKAPVATEEDVQAIAGMLRRSGLIEVHEEAVIRNILELGKKSARDIMTPRTVAFSLPAHITVQQAREQGALWHYSRIPVYGEDNEDVIGLVSRRRILEELAADRHNTPLADLMRPIQFIVESITLDKLLLRFLDEKVHLFAVLDEFGGLAGLVTLEDVLEEILGREIIDETDQVPDLRELARQRRTTALRLHG